MQVPLSTSGSVFKRSQSGFSRVRSIVRQSEQHPGRTGTTSPERRKQEQQTDIMLDTVIAFCCSRIVAQSGWTGLLRGMTPTMLREGHGMGVYFLTYEFLVQRQLHGRPREELSNLMAMLFGASAGVTVRRMRSGQRGLLRPCCSEC